MAKTKKIQIELPPKKDTIDKIEPHDGSVDDIPMNDEKPLIGFKKDTLRNLIRSEIQKALKERGIKRMDEYVGMTDEIVGVNGEIEIGTAHGGKQIAIALRESGDMQPLKYVIFEKNKIIDIIKILIKYQKTIQ